MRLFQKLKKKTDYKLEKVMIYAKITELKDRYMIYNAVKNERKWRNKEMDLDNEELESTKKMREKKCVCCEEIEFWKQMNKDRDKFEDKYYAQICVYTYYKDTSIMKRKKGQITTKPYGLNYCPKCGRKLN